MNRLKLNPLLKLTVFLTFLLSLFICSSASAITAKSPNEIKAWLDNEKTQARQHGDGNCTDFCNDYLQYFWGTTRVGGHANAWVCPAGFTQVDVGGDIHKLQVGDIIQEVYGDYGHVCIFYGINANGMAEVLQQNTFGKHYVYSGVWALPFSNTPTYVYRGPTDTVKPKITNAIATNITSSGYTVSCNVSDNVDIHHVAFPTWTKQNDQDDLIWFDGTVKNGVATYRVKVSDHNNERNCRYITHIYAYDAAGNYDVVGVEATVPAQAGAEMAYGRAPIIVDGDYLIVPTAKKTMFLDIRGTDKKAPNGTKVTLWERDGTPNQSDIWTVTYKNNFYTIKQKGTNMCLDVEENNGSKLKQGTQVQVWESTGSSNQQWAIEKNGDGYSIIARCSGFYLDVAGANFQNDVKIQQYEGNSSAAQVWTFIPYRNGKLADGTSATATPTRAQVQNTPAPASNISFSFVDDNQMYFIGDTTAQFGYIKVTSTGDLRKATIIGCDLADAYANILASHEESSYIKGNEIKHYFRINGDPKESDIFYILKPNTKYMFRSYVICEGKRYYSTWREFTTTNSTRQTEPVVTNAPVVNEAKFNFEDDNLMFFINETTAQFGYIRVTGNVNIDDVKTIGCELADAQNNILAAYEEDTWIKNNTIVHYFRVNGIPNESDILYALTPGTSYKFRSYVLYNDKKYYSDWKAFMTTGVAPTVVQVKTEEPAPSAEEEPSETEETVEKDLSVLNAPDPITKLDIMFDRLEEPTENPPYESYCAFTKVKKVIVRQDPNPKGKTVTRVEKPKTEVLVIGEEYDSDGTLWCEVRLQDGREGYIRGDLLTRDQGVTATKAPDEQPSKPQEENQTADAQPSKPQEQDQTPSVQANEPQVQSQTTDAQSYEPQETNQEPDTQYNETPEQNQTADGQADEPQEANRIPDEQASEPQEQNQTADAQPSDTEESNQQNSSGSHYSVYMIYEMPLTWEEAKRFCEEAGGHLATITSREEQDAINKTIGTGSLNGYWIGGYLAGGQWQWVTGEAWNYKNWATDQPDNYLGEETKLMVYRISNPNARSTALGTWNDIKEDGSCNGEEFFGTDNLGFIIEWEGT